MYVENSFKQCENAMKCESLTQVSPSNLTESADRQMEKAFVAKGGQI